MLVHKKKIIWSNLVSLLPALKSGAICRCTLYYFFFLTSPYLKSKEKKLIKSPLRSFLLLYTSSLFAHYFWTRLKSLSVFSSCAINNKFNRFMTIQRLIAWQLTNNWLKPTNSWPLFEDCLMTALMNVWWLPDNCLMTAWWLLDVCLMTFCWLPDNLLTNAKQLKVS